MSIRQGNKVLSAGQSLTQNLFDFKWADHILDDIQWLRADTFTWHDGRVYEAAYQHLLAEWNEVGDVPSTEIIAGTQIYYRLAPDGHKICSASQEDEAVAIYEDTGVAWYYIIDTTNQRFKLPRTKFGITGLRDTVGKYVAAGLPNISGYLSTGFVQAQEGNGAFSVRLPKLNRNIPSGSDTYQSGWGWDFSASNSNSIYGASTTVQSPATQMYLYFFVGNFAQSAVVNTAGINATLVDEIQGECINLQNNKQDIATSVNYKNITNCITNIPQDIKLELNNGTLTLKAGSKVYVPNGVDTFDTYTATSDITLSAQLYNNSKIPLVYAEGYGIVALVSQASGAIASRPAASSSYLLYYATDDNKCYFDNGSWVQCSFPIALVSRNNSVGYYSIDQVFNGFGYIGSTVFALPGVKGLIPNGRNTDGTLNNTEWVCSSVVIRTFSSSENHNMIFAFNGNYIGRDYIENVKYDEKLNLVFDGNNNWRNTIIGFGKLTSGVISNFRVKTAFHAVDYSEADFVVDFQRPTASNDYKWYRKYKSGWVEQGGLAPSGSAHPYPVVLPITMSSSNYSVQLSISDPSPTDNNLSVCSWNNCTTTGFNIYRAYNGNSHPSSPVWWEVKGFAA